MKVIAREHKTVEKELDLEYPIHLYFQSEIGEDELVKLYSDYKISVFFTIFGVKIKQENYHGGYTEHSILNNQTTKEHFDETFQEAIEHLTQLKDGRR